MESSASRPGVDTRRSRLASTVREVEAEVDANLNPLAGSGAPTAGVVGRAGLEPATKGLQIEIRDLHIHDLRRTLGSWLASGGTSLPIIGKALNHKTPDATQVYARLMLVPVRNAMEEATSAMRKAGEL